MSNQVNQIIDRIDTVEATRRNHCTVRLLFCRTCRSQRRVDACQHINNCKMHQPSVYAGPHQQHTDLPVGIQPSHNQQHVADGRIHYHQFITSHDHSFLSSTNIGSCPNTCTTCTVAFLGQTPVYRSWRQYYFGRCAWHIRWLAVSLFFTFLPFRRSVFRPSYFSTVPFSILSSFIFFSDRPASSSRAFSEATRCARYF